MGVVVGEAVGSPGARRSRCVEGCDVVVELAHVEDGLVASTDAASGLLRGREERVARGDGVGCILVALLGVTAVGGCTGNVAADRDNVYLFLVDDRVLEEGCVAEAGAVVGIEVRDRAVVDAVVILRNDGVERHGAEQLVEASAATGMTTIQTTSHVAASRVRRWDCVHGGGWGGHSRGASRGSGRARAVEIEVE